MLSHVCKKECHCDVKDCDDFGMTMFWVACKHVVTFVVTDFHTDKSVCNDLHAHVCAVSSLTFLDTSNHTKKNPVDQVLSFDQ